MSRRVLSIPSDPPSRAAERGVALLVVVTLLGLFLALSAGIATQTRLDVRMQSSFEEHSRDFYFAEAGLNRGKEEFGALFRDQRLPTAADLLPRTFALGNGDIRYQLIAPPTGNGQQVQVPAGTQFAGLDATLYRYTAVSQSLSHAGTVADNDLGLQFDIFNIPLFQFGAFYQGNLEILPGPDMFLHGRVHTNGDLYLNANNQLRIEDFPPAIRTVRVSAAGNLFRGRLNANQCTGRVFIDLPVDADGNGNLDPLELTCRGSGTRLVPPSEVANWQGNISVNVPNISVPQPSVLDRGGTFWSQADLRIVLDVNPGAPRQSLTSIGPVPVVGPALRPIEVLQVDGTRDVRRTTLLQTFMVLNPGKIFYNEVPSCAAGNVTCASNRQSYAPAFANSADIYRRADDGGLDPRWRLVPGSLDYRRGGFFNNRERTWMYLLNVDVQALLAWNATLPPTNRLFDPNDATGGGGIVLYLSVAGPASGGINNYGVRVFDSADLPFATTNTADPTGLTVVTDQAMYVQGNYNSLTQDPASLIGDSLNILSDSWEATNQNDRKSATPLGSRTVTARQTDINAAFLAGVDVTNGANGYNGGLENYPRFHEDWTHRILRYRGSFVSLGTPRHVSGPWCGTGATCNIYDPPDRDWDYDVAFNNFANLPPFTPQFTFVQQVFFNQDFR